MIDWNYDRWTPWAQPCVPFYLTLTLNASFEPLRQAIGSTLFTSVIVFEKGTGTWAFRNDEAAALGNRMLDYLHVPAHRNDFEDELARSVVELEAILDGFEADNDEGAAIAAPNISSKLDELRTAYYRFYRLGAFVEPVQIAAQLQLKSALIKAARAAGAVDDDEASDMASASYAIAEESYATGITRELCRLAARLAGKSIADERVAAFLAELPPHDQWPEEGHKHVVDYVKVLRGLDEDLYQDFATHAKRYRWSLNNYARCLEMSPADVLTEILSYGSSPQAAAKALETEIANVEANIATTQGIKRRLAINLSPFDASTLSLHDLIGARLLDLRKRIVLRTNGAFTSLLYSLAQQLESCVKDLLYLLPEEIESYIADKGRYEDRISLRKASMLVYKADLSVLDEQAYHLASGFSPMDGTILGEGSDGTMALAERLDQHLNFLKQGKSAEGDILGTTVYYDKKQPVLRGTVAVIRDVVKDQIEIGDILVASSTTPDFMGAIRRCSAIVADWGGETSHAAITARELGKPCIIGTNFASMVLRSGESVEIDFAVGCIRLISRE